MKRKYELQLANFVCKFGKRNLLDFPDIVEKVFFSGISVRQYRDTRYIIRDVELVLIDGGIAIIAGRFIRDGYLYREQIYGEDGVLVVDYEKMQSSPSALFFLVLNDHRLLYYNETSHAPLLKVFEKTVKWFFRNARKEIINTILSSDTSRAKYIEEYGDTITRVFLNTLIPNPSVDFVPIASADSFKNFIEKFAILKKITVSIIDTNNELDAEALFQSLREQGQKLNGQNTKLVHNSKDGLDKEEVVREFGGTAASGVDAVQFEGVGIDGNVMRGNAEDYNVRVPIEALPVSLSEAALAANAIYRQLQAKGIVGKPVPLEDVSAKIDYLKRSVRDVK